jgi:BirA family biotin operon repressor/biotin-[acetyl-CoA-carboxylase] ligase
VIVDERTKQLLAASTRFADIRERPEVDSTNRHLMDLARSGAPEGVVVVADHQTAGRGRRGRAWDAAPGAALLASILLRPAAAGLAPEQRWLAPASVALAAVEACATAGAAATIKWPNDLLLGGRKLAGILAEADAGAVVVGIGINVTGAPPGAASLGGSVTRGALLAALLENLERWCRHWEEVGPAYQAKCATVGRWVRVATRDQSVVGRAEAVEPDGRLRVVVAGEEFRFSAADVVHLRPGASGRES